MALAEIAAHDELGNARSEFYGVRFGYLVGDAWRTFPLAPLLLRDKVLLAYIDSQGCADQKFGFSK
ncbi:MAG: hypothetical protein ACK47M_12815 [Caldilinea sp.]